MGKPLWRGWQRGFEPLEHRRMLAVDLLADAAGLSGAQSARVNGIDYFFADNGITGRELWKSDGSATGTSLVKDLTPGSASTELHAIYNIGEYAVFLTIERQSLSGGRLNDDYTLWSSDGTAGGTVKLAEFKSSVSFLVTQVGDELAILHHTRAPFHDQATDAALYFTGGTESTTRLVRSFPAVQDGGDIDGMGFIAVHLLAANGRVVFDNIAKSQVWSSDGTAKGTFELEELSTRIRNHKLDPTGMAEVNGKVVIPGNGGGDLYTTDGTVKGTVAHPVSLPGGLDPWFAVSGNTYYFVNVRSLEDHRTIRKTLYALDLDTNTLTNVYETSGDGSDNAIQVFKAGSRVIFMDSDSGKFTTTLYATNGTPASTTSLAAFNEFVLVSKPVGIGESSYFAIATGPYVIDAHDHGAPFGWLGIDNAARIINAPGISELQLWRTDGTPETTGFICNIWEGDVIGNDVTTRITEASGKLVAETTIRTGIDPKDMSKFQSQSQFTNVYDPRELSVGRNGATARLVHGILRLGGSTKDDNVSLWRSSRNPEKLVVAYNGNERTFPFASVNKIIVDLQAGNDRFEILEAEGGPIRARTSVYGGDGADTLITGLGRDTIVGGNGGDLIRTRGNADVISGGGGRDRINSGAGDDQIAGGTGQDQIVAGGGVDVLFGQNAVEMAFGEDIEGNNIWDDVLLTP